MNRIKNLDCFIRDVPSAWRVNKKELDFEKNDFISPCKNITGSLCRRV